MLNVGGNVPVLGPDDSVLSYTHPARARKLVKSGRAVVANERPFIIRLKQTPKEGNMPQEIINFTKFFAEERDIYVQNKSNTQVSMPPSVAPSGISQWLVATGEPSEVVAQFLAGP